MTDFSEALRVLKTGGKVTRDGWNGPGQWVVGQKGYPDGIPINANTSRATGIPEGTTCVFLPYMMLRTTEGTFVPWSASQTDLWAEDWRVLP